MGRHRGGRQSPRPVTSISVWNHSLRKVPINAFSLARGEASAEQSERSSVASFLILVVNFNEEWGLMGSEIHLLVIIMHTNKSHGSCGELWTACWGQGTARGTVSWRQLEGQRGSQALVTPSVDLGSGKLKLFIGCSEASGCPEASSACSQHKPNFLRK